MIVYVAGKMTGLPDKGRVSFSRAESLLNWRGYFVLSPAWLSDGLPKKVYLPICLAMVDQADAVVMLPGWKGSKGAEIERAYALYNEKPVYELDELIGDDGHADGD